MNQITHFNTIANPSWADWIEHHATFYNWETEGQLKMLLAWSKYFDDEGFGPEELMAASKDLTDVKIWKKEDTIYELEKAVKQRRENNRSRNEPEPVECKICLGFGLISVPFIKHIKDGVWGSRYTCGVSCHCLNGIKYRSNPTEKYPQTIMTLEQYEKINPFWERLMANFRESERKLAELMKEQNPKKNEELNKILDKIISRQKEQKANKQPNPIKLIVDDSVRTYG